MKTKRYEILTTDNLWLAEIEVPVDDKNDSLWYKTKEIMRDNDLRYSELVIVEVASFITFKDLLYEDSLIEEE